MIIDSYPMFLTLNVRNYPDLGLHEDNVFTADDLDRFQDARNHITV